MFYSLVNIWDIYSYRNHCFYHLSTFEMLFVWEYFFFPMCDNNVGSKMFKLMAYFVEMVELCILLLL